MTTRNTKPNTTDAHTVPNLSDSALVLLSAAAQRDDGHLLPVPDGLKARGGALTVVLRRLLADGLVQEVPVQDVAKAWREHGDPDAPAIVGMGLTASQAGLAAVGLAAPSEPSTQATPVVADAEAARKLAATKSEPADAPALPPTPTPFRAGTKQARLVELLGASDGVTIADLEAALGWQSHTVRAALSGLRKRGYTIERGSTDGVTHYCIAEGNCIANDSGGEGHSGGTVASAGGEGDEPIGDAAQTADRPAGDVS